MEHVEGFLINNLSTCCFIGSIDWNHVYFNMSKLLWEIIFLAFVSDICQSNTYEKISQPLFCRQNNLDLFIWSLFRALLRFFANRFVKFSLSDWNIFLEFVFLEAENWRMRWWWANIIGFSSFSLKFHENFIEKRIKHEETFRKSLKNVNFDDLWVKLKSLGKDFYVEIAPTWFLEVKRVEDLFIMHRFSQYRCQSLLRAAPLPSKYF